MKIDIQTQAQINRPDPTLYQEIKKINLVNLPVADIQPSEIPFPKSCSEFDRSLERSWYQHHGAIVERAFFGKKSRLPLRSIFPGPYIPWLGGKMEVIGDTAYSVFLKTLKTVKQRIPDLRDLKQTRAGYRYQNHYFPIVEKINQPEEGWFLDKIDCPQVEGVYFPLPESYQMGLEEKERAKKVINLVEEKCQHFCQTSIGSRTKRSRNKIREILSLIRSLEYLFSVEISDQEVAMTDEILTYFDQFKKSSPNPTEFLFELDHAVSYLNKLRKKKIILTGVYGMSWIDVFVLRLEDLIETELGNIGRILKEVRTLFTVGWAPILVHLSNGQGFNTDGTHRHYALLTVELLRRLKEAFRVPLRQIDLRSEIAAKTIIEFKKRYQKVGLSLRETVRAVNYLINDDNIWPYLDFLELNLKRIWGLEFRCVPAVYLPEWRARVVVKNLCDKGIALVGVPPVNIEIVGKSNGKKGIFVRGGYHGDDRQPNLWFDIISFQTLG